MPGFGASSPPAAPPAAPTAIATDHADPKVAELHTMFPTVETSVIEIILESVGGSQDRAIEQLLSMTDENFKVEAGSTARREAEVDLDEAFARSLALQDQERAHHEPTQPGQGYLPYQPRVKRNTPLNDPYNHNRHDQHGRPEGLDERYADRPDGQPQGQPGLLQMEQKLEQFAEVGKQTFNSFLSKAKAKYAEYQASQAQQQQQQQQNQAQGQAQGYQSGGYGERNQAQMYGEESAAGWTRTGNAAGGGRGGASNWTRDQRSNSRSTSFSSESTFSRDEAEAAKPAIRQSTARWNPSDTYDDATPAPSNKVDIASAGRRSPAGPAGVTGSPGAKIDASKLGFLPKKKVDLLSTSPGASTTNLAPASGSVVPSGRNSLDAAPKVGQDPNPGLRTAGADIIAKIPATPPAKSRFEDDSDDDLEYTKNPFDEK